jgi:hypothetical protein
MKEFTKHDSILDCLRDLEKMADVCGLIGGNTYPQSNLVADIPNIINAYYNLEHDGETSCFYIGFSKNDCEVGNDLDDVKDELFGGKALFLIKLTMKYRKIPTQIVDSRDIIMEVKAEI